MSTSSSSSKLPPYSDSAQSNSTRPSSASSKHTLALTEKHSIQAPLDPTLLPGRPMITYHDQLTPPPLHYTLHTPSRERYILIFFSLLFLEAGILPLILFYSLRWGAHLSITKNLAIITSLIGTVSGFKVAQRTYFLWFKNEHETRRPIGAGRYGLDFTHILINLGLAAFFVPLIIGSSLTPASAPTVAMALPCFMLTFCLPMFISGLFPSHFRLPFRVSSFPPYRPLPPLTYTIVEDIIAVDGGGKLEFRQAWRYRYEASRVMRTLLRDLALFWGISGSILAVGLIIIAWFTNDDIGYGLGYGMPWLWVFVATGVTIFWVRRELARERREWGDLLNVHLEKPLHLVETRVDREAFERMLARRSSEDIARVRSPVQLAERQVVGEADAEKRVPRMPVQGSPVDVERRTLSDGQIRDAGMQAKAQKGMSDTNVLALDPTSQPAIPSSPGLAPDLTTSAEDMPSRSRSRSPTRYSPSASDRV